MFMGCYSFQSTVYVVSFDGQNFCGQGLPNIFAVKILLSISFVYKKSLSN